MFAVPYAAVAAPWTPGDLGDQVWLDWRAEDLPAGSVSDWPSRHGSLSATQTTATSQPSKQGTEVYFPAKQNRRLTIPHLEGSEWVPHITHKAVVILFRVDVSSGSSDGTLFAINGSGGGWEQQPAIKYDRASSTISVRWRTTTSTNAIAFPISGPVSQWRCLVSRRDGINHYASLDGKDINGNYGESIVAMEDWAMPDSNVNMTGIIGDHRGDNVEMAVDTILLLQGDVSRTTAERITGWAMWRKGVQANLPATHPYRNAAPVSNGPQTAFVESTPAQWQSMVDFWMNEALSETPYEGTPINLAGWTLNFEDEFTQHTVTDDVQGRGKWFAPTHPAATGSARAVRPGVNPLDRSLGTPAASGSPDTYIQSYGTMTIRMQNVNGWKAGSFCSVNSNGYGRTWKYPYVEARMKIGPSSTGNYRGAWPAIWLKSLNYFTNRTQTNLEYDIYEGYISDVKGHHAAIHNWPAGRVLPGRLGTHRAASNYYGLQAAGNQWHVNVDLFDGQYHTYGSMVTPEWVINYFDGRELHRFPTPIEMKQPLWVLVDLAMKSSEESLASGVYDLTVDYVRIYQNPLYSDLRLEAWWTFNNNSADQSGNGLDAGRAGAGYSADAAEGIASLKFDGINDYLALSNSGTNALHRAFGRRTVICWVKTITTSGTRVIYDEGGGTSGIGLRINNGTIEAGVKEGTLHTISAPFTSTEWTHVAMIYTAGKLDLYINAHLMASASTGLGIISAHNTAAAAGAKRGGDVFGAGDGHYLNGRIDDLAVYTGAMTLDELEERTGLTGSAGGGGTSVKEAWWVFENNCADQSGNGLDAGRAGAGFSPDAAQGIASLKFDGINDYLVLSNSGANALHAAFSQRSVVCWVKTASTSGTQVIYDEGGGNSGFGLRINNGTLEGGVKEGTLHTVSTPFTSTAWTHVALTFNGSQLKLYINAQEVDSEAAALGTVGAHNTPAAAGAKRGGDIFGTGDGHYINGRIDNMSVYTGALTPVEINAAQ